MKSENHMKSGGNYPLTPLTSDWMHTIMADWQMVNELMTKYGSPLNLHHIPSFQSNIRQFQDVFEKFGLDGQIYFARKANKSKSLVKAALDFGIGVDTASYRELEEAIALGGHFENVVLTAAIKTPSIMELAMEQNVPIIIDNYDELQLAQQTAADLNRVVNIGIRLSGFTFEGRKLYSRFGFDIDKDRNKLLDWFSPNSKFHNLLLTGFHFHLDGYSIEQRAVAILQTLDLIRNFDARATKFSFLDIGGGILMNYLESRKEWGKFQERLQQAVLEEASPITFRNNGLGYRKSQVANGFEGFLQTYPYYNDTNGPDFLERILTYQKGNNRSVADRIREEKIQLRIEPGRSLLNQAGITIAKVVHRKKDSQGNWLVGLEMNTSQLKSSSADFLLDPYMMYRNPSKHDRETDLYFTGAYCLEQDVILKRKLVFPKLPEINDFAVFVNTGGYMMHFYETQAHLFDLSQNLYIPDDHFAIDTVLADDELSHLTSSRIATTKLVKEF